MESIVSALMCTPPSTQKQRPTIPPKYIWPERDLVPAQGELEEPLVDLGGFLRGDAAATRTAAALVRGACSTHGFFQVSNHGVDPEVIAAAHSHVDAFFKLPKSRKLMARRRPGSMRGYSSDYADRFSSKLLWKETLSIGFLDTDGSNSVLDFFKSELGEDFEETGAVLQRYCQAMKGLGLTITELLAICLGVERGHYREFFQDSDSCILRCNYYPTCQEPGLALGTGPHSDPTSLTILHQDQIGGLEVFTDNKWLSVRPCPDAFVINIGDTFTALTNGMYKSCVHRAVVKRDRERRSLVFFVSPRGDKVVRPPQELLVSPGMTPQPLPRLYPDFTWSDLLRFTQESYRPDTVTLQSFAARHQMNPTLLDSF